MYDDGQILKCKITHYNYRGGENMTIDKYYRLEKSNWANDQGPIYRIYDLLGNYKVEFNTSHIEQFFYTLAEERELKLKLLGI